MLTAILIIVVTLIVFILYIEYKNEKNYQEQKRKKRQNDAHTPPIENFNADSKKKPLTSEISSAPKPIEDSKTKQTTLAKSKHKYPPFTHERLVSMGFSDNDAKAFVAELIPQIENQIPLIRDAIENADFYQVEKLTHHIKGSATNIGTGGISDLLVEYNRYLKSGSDIAIVKAYFQDLVYYTNELKSQYT